MIQLYDYILSGSCYKVRLFLSMLGKEFEPIPVDYYPGGEHKTPEFLEINPLGQIPVLRDGGLTLRDAQAILVYLAGRYDNARKWYPEDAETQG
ncbi:MAG: glutathione S-transferase, partial [Rhodospirillaceae bacterium]|nr:glutathione S-transferase [Rhodospirillaceae bacterium]